MKFAIITISSIAFAIITFIVILSANNHQAVTKSSSTTPSLVLYENTTSSVSLTTFGNLVANSARIAVQIKVSSNDVNISILSGYQETMVKTEDFANNQTAYNYFLNNLNASNFLVSKTTTLDESSACPNGETYQLDLTNNSKTISNLWDDNCNPGVDGTFKGNRKQNIFAINTLFQNQVTNYADFTSNYTF
jgi:hypothetical protein